MLNDNFKIILKENHTVLYRIEEYTILVPEVTYCISNATAKNIKILKVDTAKLSILEKFVFSRNGIHMLYREHKSRYYMVGYKNN